MQDSTQRKKAYIPSICVSGNDGHEQCTCIDHAFDPLLPRVTSSKAVLVYPSMNARISQAVEDSFRSGFVLLRITDKYRRNHCAYLIGHHSIPVKEVLQRKMRRDVSVRRRCQDAAPLRLSDSCRTRACAGGTRCITVAA